VLLHRSETVADAVEAPPRWGLNKCQIGTSLQQRELAIGASLYEVRPGWGLRGWEPEVQGTSTE